jgi:membrane protease YdiL (CAAX protease family)
MSTTQPTKNTVKTVWHAFISSSAWRWFRKIVVLTIFSLVVNHLSARDSFPDSQSYRFPIEGFGVVPGITKLTGLTIDYSSFDQLRGNLPACLVALLIVWGSAGFGEEIIFRGYFMRQFVKFFGESKVSIVLNIVLLACFFGFMHSYQGITGQLVTGIAGALLALIFYLRKYDLWFIIAVHGFFDTIALICVYFGLHHEFI